MKIKLLSLLSLALALNSCRTETEKNSLTGHEASASINKSINDRTITHKFLINGNSVYVDEINGTYFYADDITISNRQFELLKKMQNSHEGFYSTIFKDVSHTWPDATIYYKLPEPDLKKDPQQYTQTAFIANIKKAFDMISDKETKIKFVERTNQPEYIHFNYSTGSNSPLGWEKGRVNEINITADAYSGTIASPGEIAHEIMHSMGFHHEQTRPDRDKYLKINTDNVEKGRLKNFNINPDFKGFGDLDFESVMMYDSYDFAKNPNNPVMTKMDGSTFHSQREKLTDGDYAGIKELYKTKH
ncbi:M12 family metallopeptidase [Elizabethkingia ursingii]